MHELSIAQSILDIVAQELAQEQPDPGHPGQDQTRLADQRRARGPGTWGFQALTIGTPLESRRVRAGGRCPPCTAAPSAATSSPPRPRGRLFVPCPACGEEFGHKVLAGKELYIDFIEAQ